MCFEYLGIPNPTPSLQFEDYLEQHRKDKKYGARTASETRRKIAVDLGVKYEILIYDESNPISEQNSKAQLLSKLKEGCAVMLSVWPVCKGHLVRLQDVTDSGLIVDDPYGKVTNFETRENCGSGGYDANSETAAGSKGKDNLWKWEDIEGITIKYAEIYCK